MVKVKGIKENRLFSLIPLLMGKSDRRELFTTITNTPKIRALPKMLPSKLPKIRYVTKID